MAHASCTPIGAFRLPPVASPLVASACNDPLGDDGLDTPGRASRADTHAARRAPWWSRLSAQLGWFEPTADRAVLPSGFPVLDAALPGGGWPQHGVVEVLAPQPGHPELALLAPALVAAASRQQRFGVIAAPAAGNSIDTLDRLLSNEPDARRCPSDDLAATGGPEAEFRSPASALSDALAWLKKGLGGVLAVWLSDLGATQLRELKRVARRRQTLVFAVRPWIASWDDSEADLRVCLIAGKGRQWEVRVHRHAGTAAPTVRVPALGTAPARHLRVVRDPQDHRRALLSGSFVEVCAELDRLAEIEHLAESTLPAYRAASIGTPDN